MENENEDLYKDLTIKSESDSDESESENTELLQEQIRLQEKHIQSLENDIEKLCAKIMEMKKIQDNLTKNISELYKTAKSEINRKDKKIAELQSQFDACTLQKSNNNSVFKFYGKQKYEPNVNEPRDNMENVNEPDSKRLKSDIQLRKTSHDTLQRSRSRSPNRFKNYDQSREENVYYNRQRHGCTYRRY